jgi:hypothetical protein
MIDVIMIGVLLFVLGITVLFSSVFLTAFQTHEQFEGTIAQETIKQTKLTMNSFNSWYPFIFIGLIGAVVIGAYFVRTHPVFFVVSLGLLIVVIILSGIFTEMFDEFASHDAFADEIDDYSTIVSTFNNFPVLTLIAGIVIMISLYAKFGRGSGGPTY